MLAQTPHYELTAPMFISARLLPAVRVADATVSASAHAMEADGRVHFFFHIDVPGVGEWTSPESYVTAIAPDWTRAVARALETFCGSWDSIFEDMPPNAFSVWMMDRDDDFSLIAHDLDEWLDTHA